MEGECSTKPDVPASSQEQPKWGPWSDFGVCKHGCIASSQGYQERYRRCNYNGAEGCHGNAIEVKTCSNVDSNQCSAYQSPTEFASKACKNFMEKNTRLSMSLKPEGKQMGHNNYRPSDACTIYCAQVCSISMT